MSKRKDKLYDGERLEDFKELIDRYENRYHDKVAFVYKENPKSKEHIKITYKQFAQDIKQLATALLDMNMQNKKIALIGPNRYEWCVSYLAITTADISIVPLDKSLPENEIKSLIERSKADAVIFDSKYASVFEEIIAEDHTNLKQYICMDKTDNEHFITYPDLCEKGKCL